MRQRLTMGILIAAVFLVASATGMAADGGAGVGDERAVPARLTQAEAEKLAAADLIAHGRDLFNAKFTFIEGVTRPGATGAIIPTAAEPSALPPFFRTAGADSNGCKGCHNDPAPGGAGDFVTTAFVSEGFSDADFDTVDPQFSNERGTPALNGSGFVELLAREMTADLRAQRATARRQARQTVNPVRVELTSKGISFGFLSVDPDGFADVDELTGVDQDLIIRPFSQKGVFTSLRQFTVNAMNAHHGIQAVERFGKAMTDTDDFDGDGVENELRAGDVTALVAFQATLDLPRQVVPGSAARAAAIEPGRALFVQTGCADCHVPALPLNETLFREPNPYNPAGNLRPGDVAAPLSFDLAALAAAAGLARDDRGRILVPVYSDFKRHRIADDATPHFANELLAQRFVNRDVFLTARLWGVGETAPYGHRGDLTTLREAIAAHGAEGATARVAYEALADADQARLIEFLLSLRLSPETPR